MKITKEKLSSFEDGTKYEWLITNGMGGYASSTIIGANTRKYHGLLIASLYKTGERYLVLSKLNESVCIEDREYSLSSNECQGYIEEGYKNQESFEKEYLPEFEYRVEDVIIKKIVAMENGENQIGVLYNIKTKENPVTIKIRPLINFRSFHETRRIPTHTQTISKNQLSIKLNDIYNLNMKITEGTYEKYSDTYYKNMYYRVENERGLDDTEDHYMPGEYKIEIEKGQDITFEFIASVSRERSLNEKVSAFQIVKNEENRLKKICKIANAKTEIEKILAIAADNFIINKSYGTTIIAGYPWFGDWGRDTFISLEGLTLKTNRYSDAKNIIINFSKYIKDGLLPNLISENGGQAYNSVDASLWYIEAIYKYYEYTKDTKLIKLIYPKLIEIIEAYKKGTLYDIKMDRDGLILAGNENTQLTWMDAKVGGIIPTSRHGKAVEINALWYNAIKIMELFADAIGEKFDVELSKKVKKSFDKFYTNNGLLDTIDPINSQIRPNQLFTISLSFPIVTGEKAKEILSLITDKLYTNKGLKTLNSEDKEYVGKYEGSVYQRDISYHQGIVWTWLLGPYKKAYERIYNEKYETKNIYELLNDRCIGNISEIYDAEEPRKAKGAFAQAWSVAGLLE